MGGSSTYKVIIMDYSCFNYELKGHVAHVILSRGKELNTMTKAFWSELPHLIDDIANNGDARVILLSAKGKHFCAGMDLANFSEGEIQKDRIDANLGRKNEATYRITKDLQYTISCLEKARMPVIAAIHGACIGSGVDMISACDLRYASKDAFFCVQEINIGLAADVGTLQRLPHIIPEGIVRELAFTGRRFSAKEAFEYGLINSIFDTQDQMIDHAESVAKEIASKSPLAISGIKEVMNYNRDHSIEESLNYVALWNAAMNYTDDMKEAFKSQLEKRDPEFEKLIKKKKYLED